jgi:hypothetical protein
VLEDHRQILLGGSISVSDRTSKKISLPVESTYVLHVRHCEEKIHEAKCLRRKYGYVKYGIF